MNKLLEIGATVLLACLIVGAVILAVLGFKAIWPDHITLIPERLSNEQIVKQSNYCTKSGLDSTEILNGITGEIVAIQCAPKEAKK